jgi:hypothetical protein
MTEEVMRMKKSGRTGAAAEKGFWKRFFVSLSLSLLATAVIVSVMSAGKTARSGTKNKLI